jgi:hypothetical protein
MPHKENLTMDTPISILNRKRRRVLDDIKRGFPRPPHISISEGKFYVVSATGISQQVPTHHIDVIIIDANPHRSRILWGDGGPGSGEPPVCFSDNGVGPSSRSTEPQSATCAVCQHNVMGSATTFREKKTTACQRRQKLAVLLPDGDTTIYLLDLSPQNVGAFDTYAAHLDRQKLPNGDRSLDVADVVTRIGWDDSSGTLFKLRFEPTEWADDEATIKLIEHVDANHLTDSVVGRDDTPTTDKPSISPPGLSPDPAMPIGGYSRPEPKSAPMFGEAPAYTAAPVFGEAPKASTPIVEKRKPGRPKNPPPFAPAATTPAASVPLFKPAESTAQPAPLAVPKFGMVDPPTPPQAILDQVMALKPRSPK